LAPEVEHVKHGARKGGRRSFCSVGVIVHLLLLLLLLLL